MGLLPWLLLLAKTGVAPTISPASTSVIASFILPGTASPPWYLGAREIRAFVRCVQGFRSAEKSATGLLGGHGSPGELAARDARDRVRLAEKREADRSAPGRRPVHDRAGHVVVDRA